MTGDNQIRGVPERFTDRSQYDSHLQERGVPGATTDKVKSSEYYVFNGNCCVVDANDAHLGARENFSDGSKQVLVVDRNPTFGTVHLWKKKQDPFWPTFLRQDGHIP